jgi:hypothetical protein
MADLPSTHSPSFDAAIRRLETCEQAASALLAALKEFHAICNDSPQDEFVMRLYRLFNRVGKTIAQAEAAGITTEGDE